MSLTSLISGIRAGLTPAEVIEIERPNIEKLDQQDQQDFWELWNTAIKTGAPIGQAIEMIQISIEHRRKFFSELEIISSAPAATRELLAWLPLIGLAVSQVIGLNPFSALDSTFGVIVFVFAFVLFAAGMFLSKKIHDKLSAVAPRTDLAPLKAAIQLRAGTPMSKVNIKNKLLKKALQAGAPMAEVLVEQYLLNQQLEFDKKRRLLAKDSVKMLIPLGLTSLPAFILLSVFPLLISSLRLVNI